MIALMGVKTSNVLNMQLLVLKNLSNNMIKALEERKACLMANHGQVAFGENLSKAFELAQEVENICHQYINCFKDGRTKESNISRNAKKILEKVKGYKRG